MASLADLLGDPFAPPASGRGPTGGAARVPTPLADMLLSDRDFYVSPWEPHPGGGGPRGPFGHGEYRQFQPEGRDRMVISPEMAREWLLSLLLYGQEV